MVRLVALYGTRLIRFQENQWLRWQDEAGRGTYYGYALKPE